MSVDLSLAGGSSHRLHTCGCSLVLKPGVPADSDVARHQAAVAAAVQDDTAAFARLSTVEQAHAWNPPTHPTSANGEGADTGADVGAGAGAGTGAAVPAVDEAKGVDEAEDNWGIEVVDSGGATDSAGTAGAGAAADDEADTTAVSESHGNADAGAGAGAGNEEQDGTCGAIAPDNDGSTAGRIKSAGSSSMPLVAIAGGVLALAAGSIGWLWSASMESHGE